MQVLYLGRAPRTKETLPDFYEKCQVTRYSRVFRGLTGSQRTPEFGASQKDFGKLSYFLGVEVISHPHGLLLSQRRYILDLLAHTNMMEAKPVLTPLPTSPPITLHIGSPLSDPSKYSAIVGSLQYLLLTRPDIAFAVNKLSQFMHKPTSDHWLLVKRLFRYLCGSVNEGILLYRDSPQSLHAFSDAQLHAFSDFDWAGNKDDFTSTSANIVYLGRNPISWSSKKQRSVAQSSTEAKYRFVANTAAELNWVCSLLDELGVSLSHSPVIYCDNVGATSLCSNPVFHSRMKHVAIDFHFILIMFNRVVYVLLMFPVKTNLLMH